MNGKKRKNILQNKKIPILSFEYSKKEKIPKQFILFVCLNKKKRNFKQF